MTIAKCLKETNASPSNSSATMTEAAEALIKAMSSHIESTSLGPDKIEEFKKLSPAVQKSIQDLKFAFHSKTNTLLQVINNLKKDVADLTEMVASQSGNHEDLFKKQTLEWAISNAHLGSFQYYVQPNIFTWYGDSKEVAKLILLSFRQGNGHDITRYRMNTASGPKEFRNAISVQIHLLTGVKPRIAMEGKSCIIYYS